MKKNKKKKEGENSRVLQRQTWVFQNEGGPEKHGRVREALRVNGLPLAPVQRAPQAQPVKTQIAAAWLFAFAGEGAGGGVGTRLRAGICAHRAQKHGE